MGVADDRSLVQLIYTSEASGQLTSAELMSVIHLARAWNEKSRVTSALFYKDGYFAQIMEGHYDAVTMACSRITRDSRHHRIVQLASRPIQTRLMPHCALKFYGGEGLNRKYPRLAQALIGYKSDKEDLLRLILLASLNL